MTNTLEKSVAWTFSACWLLAAFLPLHANPLNDALHFAVEAAEPQAEKEKYSLRKDFWEGSIESGKTAAIKHHLVKGNSYWFWLATDSKDASLNLKIYNKKGKAVPTKSKKGKHWTAVQIDVPKSGSYYVAFRIDTKEKNDADWAVAYAFK